MQRSHRKTFKDTDNLLRGKEYRDLKESYILFISKSDPFEKGFSSYTPIQVLKEEPDTKIDDRTHKVVYNASAWKSEKDSAIRSFLHYVYENTPEDEFTDEITRRVSMLKADEIFKGDYRQVTLHDQDMMDIGRKEGAREATEENAWNLITKTTLPPQVIAECCSIPLEKVMSLKEKANLQSHSLER